MALTQEDLQALSDLIDHKVSNAVANVTAPPENHGQPDAANDVNSEGAPVYYVHLANGQVVESKDAGSTHVMVGDERVAVVERFQKGV